mgnify:CR=1 FL=1
MNLLALKSRQFRLYIFSVHIALNGFWAQRVIIGWLAWDLSGSAGFVGFVAFLNLLPTIFVSFLFGVIADRIDVRLGTITTYSCAGIVSAGLAVIYFADLLNSFLLACFSLIAGFITSANHPIRMSLAPRLAPLEHLSSVVAFTSLNFNLSRLIGPVIGGVLLNYIGIASAIFLTALTYTAPIIAIYFTHPRGRQNGLTNDHSGYIFELKEGLTYVANHRILQVAIIFSFVTAFAGRSVLETLPILANDVFGRGPSALGLMTSAAGGGAVIAALLKTFLSAPKPNTFPLHSLILVVTTPLLVILVSFATDFYHMTLLVAVLGMSITFTAISLQSLVQMRIEDHFRGRVMGLWTTITMGSGAIGAFTMGLIAELFGASTAQFSIGTVLATLGLIAISRLSTRKS